MPIKRLAFWLTLLGATFLAAIYFYSLDIEPQGVTYINHSPPADEFHIENFSREKYPQAVIDTANVLPRFKNHLADMISAWETNLGIEINLVSVNSEENSDIVAERLFQLRQIGAQYTTGGILILLNPLKRQARIEVSYSLEGILPDAFVGLLAHNQLAPYMSYDFAGMAVMDTLHFLKNYVYTQAINGGLELAQQFQNTTAYQERLSFLSGGGGAKVSIAKLKEDLDWKKTLVASEKLKYLPSSNPMESVNAYLRVLHDLVGDPTLELFTAGSQLMRASYPFAPFEQLDLLKKINASRPLKLISKNKFAVITSDTPIHGFTPILLTRVDGLWRIDLVETWKNLFFDRNGNYYLRNSNNPYYFALSRFGKGGYYEIGAKGIDGNELIDLVSDLKQQDDAFSHFQLAEILFRNGFAALDALLHYEIAVEKAPDDPMFRSTLSARYRYLDFPELAIPHLQQLGDIALLQLGNTYLLAGNMIDAEKTAHRIIKRNPYSLSGLKLLSKSLEAQNKLRESKIVEQQITSLNANAEKKSNPVSLIFDPQQPVFDNRSTVNVNGTKVYGHSEFSVTMTNQSERSITVKKVLLLSKGTGTSSGLGDIKDYFPYKDKEYSLRAHESVTFNKVWGFTVDPGHQRLSYIFDVCWQGGYQEPIQCEAKVLNLKSKFQAV